MISSFQAVFLGLLQGVTELFPVSSLGHSVIIPTLLGWNIDQSSDSFVVFLVATHFATALVLLGFFWRDWVKVVQGFFRSIFYRKIVGDAYAKLAWLIVVATIPAGFLGLLFEKKFAALFAAPTAAAFFLVMNGMLLYATELRRPRKISEEHSSIDDKISKVPWLKSFYIGCAQAIALIPGFSRTGAALSGGLFNGLDHEGAVRFAFLLATPIIFAAALLKLPALFHGGYPVGATSLGALAAALGAYFSIKFLTKYFKTKTLKPFAYYCLVAGFVSFVFLVIK